MRRRRGCHWGALLFLVVPGLLSAQQIAVGEYVVPVTNGAGWGITTGADGALWFSLEYEAKIGRITTAGTFTLYSIPPIGSKTSSPEGIAAGPDGALWFADAGLNQIGRITTAGVITGYPVPTGNSGVTGITRGPDGALWFTERSANQIGRITTAGVITEYSVPTADSQPQDITGGADGALWFAEYTGGHIGKITTSGLVTEYLVPTPNAILWSITAGPDGALWFGDMTYLTPKIGRITAAGAITEYALSDPTSVPFGITTGPDGALWFGDDRYPNPQIGRITTSGAITEYPMAPYSDFPFYFVTGPGGEMWFTDDARMIGEMVFVTADLAVSPPSGGVGNPLAFTGNGFAPNEGVQIYLAGIGSPVLASATADSGGAFTAAAKVPQSPFGPRIFLGLGQTSGRLGAASFSVEARVLISPNAGAPGDTVVVSGAGFEPYYRIKFCWDSLQTQLGSIVSDAHGTFSRSNAFRFNVPANAAPGEHVVIVSGGEPSSPLRIPFTVD